MKIEIRRIITFICMVLVLGLQTLLHGSWRVQEAESLKPRSDGNS